MPCKTVSVHIINKYDNKIYRKIPHGICISNDKSNVKASIQQDAYMTPCTHDYCQLDWTMRLQRLVWNHDGSKRWKTIGTRTGYVSSQSPSHRTFTNVKKMNAQLRLQVTFHNASGTKVFYSPYIWR